MFDFGSPNSTLFILTFYYGYCLIMYRFKFASGQTSQLVNWLAVAVLATLNAQAYFCGLVNGTSYLYQSAMGQIFGFIYLVLCLTFDSHIHKLCEKSGFVLQSSRSKKFQILLYCLAFYIAFTFFYLAFAANWIAPDNWVVNIIQVSPKCSEKIEFSFNFHIGLNATYYNSALLFFLIGMVFGQSYSIQFVQPLRWVRTRWLKRVIRAVLGLFISCSMYLCFYFTVVHNDDDST